MNSLIEAEFRLLHSALRESISPILHELRNVMSAIEDLKAQVAASIAVEQSALILINGFSDRLNQAMADAASGSNAAMEQLRDELATEAASLAAAVAANTPAAPAPAPAPAPEPAPAPAPEPAPAPAPEPAPAPAPAADGTAA